MQRMTASYPAIARDSQKVRRRRTLPPTWYQPGR